MGRYSGRVRRRVHLLLMLVTLPLLLLLLTMMIMMMTLRLRCCCRMATLRCPLVFRPVSHVPATPATTVVIASDEGVRHPPPSVACFPASLISAQQEYKLSFFSTVSEVNSDFAWLLSLQNA